MATTSNLAWRLAFVLLSLGRIGDASPLLDRLKALDVEAGSSPAYLYPEGVSRPPGRPPLAGDRRPASPGDQGPERPRPAGRQHPRPGVRGGRRRRLGPGRVRAGVAGLAEGRDLSPGLRPEAPEDTPRRRRRRVASRAWPNRPKTPALRVALARSELRIQAAQAGDRRGTGGRSRPPPEGPRSRPGGPGPGAGRGRFLDVDRPSRPGDVPTRLGRPDRPPKSADLWAAFGRLAGDPGRVRMRPCSSWSGPPPRRTPATAWRSAWRGPESWPCEARKRGPRGPRRRSRPAPGAAAPRRLGGAGRPARAQGNEPAALSAYAEWAQAAPRGPGPRLFFLDRSLDRGRARGRSAGAGGDRCPGGARRRPGAPRQGRPGPRPAPKPLRPRAGRPSGSGGWAGSRPLIGEAARLAPGSRWVPLLKGRLGEARGRGTRRSRPINRSSAATRRRPPRPAAGDPGPRPDDRPLERLAAERPEVAASLWRRAALEALGRGEPDRAVRADCAVAAEPDDLDARLWRARFLEILGLPDAAEATFRTLHRHPSRRRRAGLGPDRLAIADRPGRSRPGIGGRDGVVGRERPSPALLGRARAQGRRPRRRGRRVRRGPDSMARRPRGRPSGGRSHSSTPAGPIGPRRA